MSRTNGKLSGEVGALAGLADAIKGASSGRRGCWPTVPAGRDAPGQRGCWPDPGDLPAGDPTPAEAIRKILRARLP